jgi:uncharacterized HAD superfamily protein
MIKILVRYGFHPQVLTVETVAERREIYIIFNPWLSSDDIYYHSLKITQKPGKDDKVNCHIYLL